jgi:tetratricopeptide (TPR) repeat protein
MRLTLILAVALLLFACDSGDSPYSGNGSGDGGGGAAESGTQPDQPKPPPKAVASQDAQLLDSQRKMLKAMASGQKEEAGKIAAQHEGKTLAPDAYYFLGIIQDYAGNTEASAAAFKKYVDTVDPADINYKWGVYQAAAQLAAAGNPMEAAKYAKMFGEKFGNQEPKYNQSIVGVVAQGLVKVGKLQESVPFYEDAVKLGNIPSGLELIQVYWMLGKYDEAKTVADKLVTARQGNTDLNHYQAFAARAAVLGKPLGDWGVYGWQPDDFVADSLKGKVVLVYTWGMHQLGGSKSTEHKMEEIYKTYHDKGLEIIALSEEHDIDPTRMDEKGLNLTSDEEMEGIRIWRNHYKRPWIFGLVTSTEPLERLGYTPDIKKIFPMYALIGKDGRVRFFAQGTTTAAQDMIHAAIEKLLAE